MYKIFNSTDFEKDWIDLNFQIKINNRDDTFETNHYVIGRNYIKNRLWILNKLNTLTCCNKLQMKRPVKFSVNSSMILTMVHNNRENKRCEHLG